MKSKKHSQDCKELQSMIGKDEGYTCICEINRADIGAKVAEVLERDLHDGGAWGRILDNAELTKAERQWAGRHIRWTLLDEEDGVDLLQDEEARS